MMDLCLDKHWFVDTDLILLSNGLIVISNMRVSSYKSRVYVLDNATYDNGVFGEVLPDFPDEIDKVLRVTVGDVQTDEGDLRNRVENVAQSLKVRIRHAGTGCHVL